MPNSPYDDSDELHRKPEFNRALKQGIEKNLSPGGLDFEGFYKRSAEKGPQREVGWLRQPDNREVIERVLEDYDALSAKSDNYERFLAGYISILKGIPFVISAGDSGDNNSDRWQPRRQISSKEYSDRYYDSDLIDDLSASPFQLTAEEYADYLNHEDRDYFFDGKSHEYRD